MLESLNSTNTVLYAQLLVDLYVSTQSSEYLEEARFLFESLSSSSHEDYARVLKHLASRSRFAEKFSEALDFYEQAGRAYKEMGLEQSPGYADLLMNQGTAHRKAGNSESALAAYRSSQHVYAVT